MALVDLDGAGTVTVQTLPFAPMRQVRTVRGNIDELVRFEPSSDLIKVVLTDEMLLIDPRKRLREVFPNVCQLAYARDETVQGAAFDLPNRTEVIHPIELIGDFVEFVRGKGLEGIVTLAREERERTIRGTDFHAAATTSRHVVIAAARSTRCD
jgi:exonuclease SbcD